jgi:hypothetical protein
MTVEHRLFCERCGSASPIDGDPGASYCVGCRLYLCADCQANDPLRCEACHRAGRRAVAGIGAARDALKVLLETSAQLEDLVAWPDATPDGVTPVAQSVLLEELAAVDLKRRSAERAAEHALKATRGRQRASAARLREDVGLALADIDHLREGLLRAQRRPAPLSLARLDLSDRRWPVAVAAALGVVVVFVAGISLIGRQSSAGADPTPSADEGVAAVEATPDPAGSPSPTGVPAPRHYSFDELEMGSAMPDGFIAIPSAEAVSVAAFPTAVDRSLRVAAGSEPSAACLQPVEGPSHMSILLLLDGAVPPQSPLFELQADDGRRLLAALVTESGGLELRGASPVPLAAGLEAGEWYAITVDLGADDIAELTLTTRAGARLGQARAGVDGGVGSVDRVCFGLAASQTSGGLFLDELVITQ